MEEMTPWYTGQILKGETEREQRRDSCPFWNPTSTMLLERAWVRSGDSKCQVVGHSFGPPSQGQRQKVCTLLGSTPSSAQTGCGGYNAITWEMEAGKGDGQGLH